MALTSRDVEADVLGGLMLASLHGTPLVGELAGELGDDAFTSADHRAIYATILRLAKADQPHDGIAVAEAMRGAEDGVPMADVLRLVHDTPSLVNIEHRARYLRELANRRALVSICHEVIAAADHKTAADAVASLTAKLDGVLATGAADALSFAEVVNRAEWQVQEIREAKEAGIDPGIPFGIPAVDKLTGGMRGGELIGIAARTSIGKTALANQVAVHAASKGHRGLILSLEESPEGIGLRAIANRGGVNLTKMRAGAISLFEVQRVAKDHAMRDYQLWVDTQTFDLSSISARITHYARKHKIAFAVVDHIGLVRVPQQGGKKRYEAIGEVTRTLKQLAGQLGIAIVALIQVGRDSEKESRRPMLSDLRESGNIEQDLNVCIAMHPKGMADEHGRVQLEIGLIKNRYGARCWLNEQFEFHGSVQQLRQMFHMDQESSGHAA